MTETEQNNADRLVAEWIVRRYRADHAERIDQYDGLIRGLISPRFEGPTDAQRHLVRCDQVRATAVDASDGTYGCDTGCEYVTLEATISCSHGFSEDFEYGDFGELADIIIDLEKGVDP